MFIKPEPSDMIYCKSILYLPSIFTLFKWSTFTYLECQTRYDNITIRSDYRHISDNNIKFSVNHSTYSIREKINTASSLCRSQRNLLILKTVQWSRKHTFIQLLSHTHQSITYIQYLFLKSKLSSTLLLDVTQIHKELQGTHYSTCL